MNKAKCNKSFGMSLSALVQEETFLCKISSVVKASVNEQSNRISLSRSTARGLNRRDVDLPHLHHGIECTLGHTGI